MKRNTLRRIMIAPVLAAAMFVAGCDKGPSGVYQAEGPIPLTVEFKGDKAIFAMSGTTLAESTFTVSGDTITIAKGPDDKPVKMTLNKDGTIAGPEGVKLVKKAS